MASGATRSAGDRLVLQRKDVPSSSSDRVGAPGRTATAIVCVAMTWLALAALIRGRLVFMHEDLNLMLPLRLLGAAYYELVLVVPLTAMFVAIAYFARRSPRRLRAIRRLWWVLATIMVLLDALNVVVLKYLGTSFSYQWLYYSDFLQSLEARSAILDALSWSLIAAAVAVIAVFAACAFALRAAAGFVLSRGYLSPRALGYAAGITAVLCLPIARWELDQNFWSSSRIANPVVAFIGSFAVHSAPPIFTMPTPIGSEDFAVAAGRSPGGQGAATPMTGKGRDAKIKNVLVFVFESTPADYVDLYGSVHHATPELRKLRSESLVFRNAYAHSPVTNVSLVSVLTATYPWISTQFITQAHPDLPLHSLSGELKQHGARTAFFNSADLSFKTADKFLERHGFDLLRDDRNIPCDKPLNRAGGEGTLLSAAWNGDGIDDECTARALIDWVGEDPGRPFFAMMWTMMTHFPYFAGAHEFDYDVHDDRFNRYLNGLHAGDAALGKIVRNLDAMGQLDSTLIVVLGDHGEAFGRHGQYVHANKIYEENVHIPLVFINRRLFNGQESSVLAGMLDIAPTVMDLLGLPLPGDWQGRSLFAADRGRPIYFFAPWADLLFGYREGDRKFIFDATTGQYEAYDLREDPQETRNMVDEMPGAKREILDRTAAWVQYQNHLIKHLASQAVAASQ